jgi:hypothetical protein
VGEEGAAGGRVRMGCIAGVDYAWLRIEAGWIAGVDLTGMMDDWGKE